jgi:hypothetical protein
MDISEIPSYKKISYTNIVVDCFHMDILNASHYFLSHFHADHYYGLKKSFGHPVFCSITTSNLVKLKYKCDTVPLELNKIYDLEDNNSVSLIDANHCPGAVCFIFNIKGSFFLHTGDFRCTVDYTSQLLNYNFLSIYLDNTFEGHKGFPSQEEVIHRVIDIIRKNSKRTCLVPIKYKYLFCTYCVGKERLFLSVAEYFNLSIKVEPEKLKIYQCYDYVALDLLNKEVLGIVERYKNKSKEDLEFKSDISCIKRISVPEKITKNTENKKKKNEGINNSLLNYSFKRTNVLKNITNEEKENPGKYIDSGCGMNVNANNPFSRITTKEKENQIMVISTQHIEKKRLHKIIEDIKCDRVVAFCGTGWQDKTASFDWSRKDGRIIKKAIEVIYIPYSEHSSSSELIYFKENMKYERIINTVKNKNKNDYNEL